MRRSDQGQNSRPCPVGVTGSTKLSEMLARLASSPHMPANVTTIATSSGVWKVERNLHRTMEQLDVWPGGTVVVYAGDAWAHLAR